jgi:sec-independent protein translocase protein TatC
MLAKKASFIDHLDELRKRIIASVICVAVLSIVGFIFSKKALAFILTLTGIKAAYFFAPTEAFMAQVKVAIAFAIGAGFPFLLYQIWSFIGPGLTRKEQRVSLPFMGSGLFLFLTGCAFAYFVMVPYGLRFLLSFGSDSLQPIMNVSRVLEYVLWCFLGCGLLFQLPLIVFFLVKLGIIKVETLTRHRPEVIVGLLVICAVITPTGDVFTLLLISLPLILLLELSIIIARLTSKKKDRSSQ